MKFGKINKFQSCWKFCWNMRFLTTQVPLIIKTWQNQSIIVTLKILLKLWDFWPTRSCETWNLAKLINHVGNVAQILIFDHPGPVNHKNLAKSINYSHIKNFAQMWGFDHPGLGSCESSKLGKINKFESCWKFCWNLSFLTTMALQNMKIGKIKKFE